MQSRYYDPVIRRFINADGYINANGDILGFNMYAYCGNNPVNYVDYTGEVPEWMQEIGSRLKHIGTFGWRLITSPFKAMDIELGYGEGLGVKANCKISAVDVTVSAMYSQSESITYSDDNLDVVYEEKIELAVELNGFPLGVKQSNSHSLYDPLCTCTGCSTLVDKSKCPANKVTYTKDTNPFSIGFDIEAYFFYGGKASVNFDFQKWGEDLVDIFNYGLSYGGH